MPNSVFLLIAVLTCSLGSTGATAQAAGIEAVKTTNLPAKLRCRAQQTAGLHDYAGPPEEYEASTFFESRFELRINRVLTRHLASSPTSTTPDLFLTLLPSNDTPVELRCRQVQGNNQSLGYSCTNTPPAELLLINPATLRFTRASIGGWTFSNTDKTPNPTPDSDQTTEPDTAAETDSDESLFVEYGTCEKA